MDLLPHLLNEDMEDCSSFTVTDLLNKLPRDVLPSIFALLSLEDLKNWRLVSKYWYEICSVAEIIKKEKFVFHYALCGNDAASLEKQIIDCKRIRSTIEFHGFSLKRLSLDVWSHFGVMLTSLLIHECHVDDEILTRIIVHCPNLVHLHLQVHSTYESRIFLSTCLDRLVEEQVKQSKLRSLKIFSRYFPVPDEAFFKLFQIYPNIEIFGRDFLFISDTSANVVIEFFSRLTQLVKIDLRILSVLKRDHREEQMQLLKTNVVAILNSLSQIRALRLESNCVFRYTEEEFCAFLRAIQNLESLHLNFYNFNFDSFQPNNCRLPSIEYKFLTDLRLTCPPNSASNYDANVMSLQILQRCHSSLRYLHISGENINDQLIECITRDHNELKKLDVPGMKCHEDCDTRLDRRPIDRLRNLEFLNFRFPEKSCMVDTLLRLDCSYLKVFQTSRISSFEKFLSLLHLLAMRAPNLETLGLLTDSWLDPNEYDLFFERFYKQMRRFHKLRYLILDENWVVSDGDEVVNVLFTECSTLVYVIYPSSRTVCYRFMGSLRRDLQYHDNICDNLNIFRTVEYAGL